MMSSQNSEGMDPKVSEESILQDENEGEGSSDKQPQQRATPHRKAKNNYENVLEKLRTMMGEPCSVPDLYQVLQQLQSTGSILPKDANQIICDTLRSNFLDEESRAQFVESVISFQNKNGEQFMIENDYEDTPIHAACSQDFISFMEYCQSLFLDPTEVYLIRDKIGDTPLHAASKGGALEAMKHIKKTVSKEVWTQLLRMPNKKRQLCYDVCCEEYLVEEGGRRKDESSVEWRIRRTREENNRNFRREAVLKFLIGEDGFFSPIIFYHSDCLDHLGPVMPMQQQQQLQQQQQQQQQQQPRGKSPVNTNEEMPTSSQAKTPAESEDKKPKRRENNLFDWDSWESPDRIAAIMNLVRPLQEDGRIRIREDFEPATREQLETVHTKEYIDLVHVLSAELQNTNEIVCFTPRVQAAMQKLDTSEQKSTDISDTGFSEGTLRAATRAAGSVCSAIDSVLKNETRKAFCIVRPPGHHAVRQKKRIDFNIQGKNGLIEDATSCGFCVFNNVMVGVFHALKTVSKVAIVDIDVHHGNGTEEIIREFHEKLPAGAPPKVLFLSTHLYDHSNTGGNSADSNDSNGYNFYPGTGDKSDIVNNVFNIPLKPLWRRRLGKVQLELTWVERFYLEHWGRREFRRVVEERIIPPLRAFHPDLILISAGFDAAWKDVGNHRMISSKTLDGFDLERDDFHWVAKELSNLADVCCEGRIVSVLEGGYGREHANGQSSQSAASGNRHSNNNNNNNNINNSRRGGHNLLQSKFDRRLLARNVLSYVEGLCGLACRPLEKDDDESDEESEVYADFVAPVYNDEDAGGGTDFMNFDDGLATTRRSSRVRRAQGKSGTMQRPSVNQRLANYQQQARRLGKGDEDDPVEPYAPSRKRKRESGVGQGTISHTSSKEDYEEKRGREEAMEYLVKLRAAFPDDETQYLEFLRIMGDFKKGAKNIHDVITAVKRLFAGHNDLILGFNTFLPQQHWIQPEDLDT